MNDFVIEAQKIPAPERHSYIFKCFDNLEAGESLLIINSHDPIPLLRQFNDLRPGDFDHLYLDEGPAIWKVRITKRKKEGCCGFCGN